MANSRGINTSLLTDMADDGLLPTLIGLDGIFDNIPLKDLSYTYPQRVSAKQTSGKERVG